VAQDSASSASVDFLERCMQYPEPVTVFKMVDGINLDGSSSFAPFITADELTLFFTSDRMSPYSDEKTGQSIESGFVAHRASLSSAWQIDYLFKIIDALNEGIVGLSLDGKKIFVHTGVNDIYVLERDVYGRVSRPSSVGKYYGIKLSHKYRISSCAISADERTFYITTDMPGGFGGYDVWKTERGDEKGAWSSWENLGASVNTAGNEVSVSVVPDNSSLFVSSDGRLGFGGLDLYRFDVLDSGGSYEAVHLGYPINTVNNDVYYYSVPNASVSGAGAHAYYSTQRSKGANVYDIYFVNYEVPILSERDKEVKRNEYEGNLKQRTKDSLLLVLASLHARDSIVLAATSASKEALSKIAMERDSLRNMVLAREQAFVAESERMKKAADVRETALLAEQKRREDSLANVFSNQYNNILPEKGGHTDLHSISNPAQGMKVYLSNVYFGQGESNLLLSSFYVLDEVFAFLQRFPDIRIEVGGHTSREGSYAVNQRLSEARAKSVYNYLIRKGILPERVTYRGYNYSQSIEDESTEVGRMINRRVEITVL
jgi:outer membrane protein OmpA-like peptidoglycan-associated protein